MTISKKIQELVRGSNTLRSPKQALEAMFQMAFLTMPTEKVFLARFPAGCIRVPKEYCSPLRLSEVDQERLRVIVRMYLELVAKSEPFSDVLGQLYDEYLGEELGQYFTPTDVAMLLGDLSMVTSKMSKERVLARKHRKVLDFCCGGGSLVMAFINTVYREHGKDGVVLLDIEVQDIDEEMCRLTALQILMSSLIHGIPFSSLKVIHGNVLTGIGEKIFLQCIPDKTRYLFSHSIYQAKETVEEF